MGGITGNKMDSRLRPAGMTLDRCLIKHVGHDEEGGMRVNHRGYHRPQAQVLPKTIGMMLSGTVFGKVL